MLSITELSCLLLTHITYKKNSSVQKKSINVVQSKGPRPCLQLHTHTYTHKHKHTHKHNHNHMHTQASIKILLPKELSKLKQHQSISQSVNKLGSDSQDETNAHEQNVESRNHSNVRNQNSDTRSAAW